MISQGWLHFVEYELQVIALAIFAILYALRVRYLLRLPLPREKAPAKGNPSLGVAASFSALFCPWSMESTSRDIGRWIEFAVYHLAAAAAIGTTFLLPFAPGTMTLTTRRVFAAIIVLGVLAGFIKLVRRVVNPYLRWVSTPDDYFSLAAIQVFFVSAAACLVFYTDILRFAYFLITALFLIYVPFSKISHYLYWFFARTFLGLRYGRRGVIPRKGLA